MLFVDYWEIMITWYYFTEQSTWNFVSNYSLSKLLSNVVWEMRPELHADHVCCTLTSAAIQ